MKKSKGFTLIELMILVIIIAILATLAIPRFMAVGERSKQREAQKILKMFYSAEKAYRREFNTYFGDGRCASRNRPEPFDIKVNIPLDAKYEYCIKADSNSFTVTATTIDPKGLDDDFTPDIWTINEYGDLECESDDLKE